MPAVAADARAMGREVIDENVARMILVALANLIIKASRRDFGDKATTVQKCKKLNTSEDIR